MRTKGYAEALDELDALHRAGKISDSRYELHRQQLMAGARHDSSLVVRAGRTVWTVAAVAALLAVVLLLAWLLV